MLSLNTNQVEHFSRNWIAFGFFVYFGSFFLLKQGGIVIPFLIFIALPALTLCIVSRFKCIHDKRSIFVCAAFLGYLSLSALWGEESLFKAISQSLCILCLMLSVEKVSQKFSEDFVMKSIIVIGLVAAISYTVAIFLSGHDLMAFVTGRFSFFEMGGWGNTNPIHSAVVIGVPILAAWYFFPGKSWYVKLALIVTIMLCAMLMFFTKSRGPMLAVVIMLLCIALYRRERSDLFLLSFFAVVAGVLFLFVDNLGDIIVNRFEEKNYRLAIWRGGLELFRDHWLFGQGYGTPARIMDESLFSPASHTHNTVFEVFRIGGMIGGVLFVYVLVSMIRFSYIHSKNVFYLFWLLFGLLSLATNGRSPLINPGYYGFFSFWLPLFLFYYMRKIPDSPTTDVSVTPEKAG